MITIKVQDWYPFKWRKNFAILCPFHEEKTPSCTIVPDKGVFHCFGCRAHGFISDDFSLCLEEPPEEKS